MSPLRGVAILALGALLMGGVHAQDSTLAEFQIPSRVFFSEEALPRIASGKFNKRGVRLDVMSRLGLTEQT